MLDGTHYFECTCGQPTHTLRFILDNDGVENTEEEDFDWPPTIYTEVMMSHYRPWYSRIWIAIKYIFAMDTPDHYGCWELHEPDADRLIGMLKEFKEGNADYIAKGKSKVLVPQRASKRAGWINDDGLYSGYEQESGDGC